MIGDGTYLMMNSEIVTAVAEGLKLTIAVVDNHGYQCILGIQRICGVSDFGNELRFRDKKTGTLTGEYVPIDFKKHAEAMGAHAVFAPTAAEITNAVQETKQRDGVTSPQLILKKACLNSAHGGMNPSKELVGLTGPAKPARATRRSLKNSVRSDDYREGESPVSRSASKVGEVGNLITRE